MCCTNVDHTLNGHSRLTTFIFSKIHICGNNTQNKCVPSQKAVEVELDKLVGQQGTINSKMPTLQRMG